MVVLGGWPRCKRSLHVGGGAVVAAAPPLLLVTPLSVPQNGEAVNTDVATRNNTQQHLTTKVRWRTKSGELVPIVRVGYLYSLYCLEEVFSETQRA